MDIGDHAPGAQVPPCDQGWLRLDEILDELDDTRARDHRMQLLAQGVPADGVGLCVRQDV